VRLPLEPGRVARPEPAPANTRRVLVVDDNVDAARIMAMVLGVAGHEVRLAHRGLDSIEAARKFQPDAVLLDIGLPDIDGFEVARRLRVEPGLEKILLVAVTGYGRDQDIRMCREAGFDEHFSKPVNPDALNALIARKPGRAPASAP
jgi:CheY-like chemotaxis protein